MAPTNVAYTSYLLAVAYAGSFPEALAALLPCYWIYWEVASSYSSAARRTRCLGVGSQPTEVVA
jgi:thiaminase/transcriptional activator TenA